MTVTSTITMEVLQKIINTCAKCWNALILKNINLYENIYLFPGGDFEMKRTDSQETPPTPLFDEDMSQPLEPFPRVNFQKDGWEMHLRQPNKKKITGQR